VAPAEPDRDSSPGQAADLRQPGGVQPGLRTVPGWTEPSWPVRRREFRWFGWFRRKSRSPWPPLFVISVVTDTYRRVAWIPMDFKVDGNSQLPPEKKLPEWF
jgi:hypothetical protein